MNEESKFKKIYCAYTAMVFDSPALRGILTAILWASTPPYPIKDFKSREEAIAWAQTQF